MVRFDIILPTNLREHLKIINEHFSFIINFHFCNYFNYNFTLCLLMFILDIRNDNLLNMILLRSGLTLALLLLSECMLTIEWHR